MKIAAVTLVRNDRQFLEKWVSYYGAQVGYCNLFLIIRGTDWELPPLPPEVSRIIVKDSPSRRKARNIWSANYVSHFVDFLLHSYDAVIRADSDEFIVADPASGQTLTEVIEQNAVLGSLSALGTDVIQKLSEEPALDPNQSVLKQRKYGIVTREFSKPCVVTSSVRWEVGFHYIHGHEVRFADNLHLFHLALHDRDAADRRIAERVDSGTSGSLLKHVRGRLDRFAEVEADDPVPGDEVYQKARDQIALPRNNGRVRTRPGKITENPNSDRGYFIKIPDRFGEVL